MNRPVSEGSESNAAPPHFYLCGAGDGLVGLAKVEAVRFTETRYLHIHV